MAVQYIRAEDLARLAGVTKTTVHAAIHRGEIATSRTVGRGTRITVETARAYLESLGCPVPPELGDARAPAVAVITERQEILDDVRSAAHPSWTITGGAQAYATMLAIGIRPPRVVIVDLDVALLQPFEVIRVMRTLPALKHTRVVALGQSPELRAAALALGAHHALDPCSSTALARALAQGPPRRGARPRVR